jgi:hypothetical protein
MGAPSEAPVPARRFHRRRVVINLKLQARLLAPILVYTVLLGVLVTACVIFPMESVALKDPEPAIRGILSQQVVVLNFRFWPVLILSALLASIFSVIRSNRLAGPLFRLRQVLDMMSKGRFLRLKFRKGDELHDFEEITNELSRKLEALSIRNGQKLTSLERRMQWLIMRHKTEEIEKEDMARELETVLGEVRQIETLRPGA